jgi:hypothetical protein
VKRLATLVVAAALTASGAGLAQPAAGSPAADASIVLVDSTGQVAARALNETMMLVSVASNGVVAPAFIRPIFDADQRAASGLATWASGGSVLFTAPACTGSAHVPASTHGGVRATSQVETPEGTILYVGAIGAATTVAARSILYGNGCMAVDVRQNGVVPVVATVNLTATYPPPLAIR